MLLSKEEYARKRIHNGYSVQLENSVTRVTVRHHSASLVMLNSYPRDGIFNQHLTTIKDSYMLIFLCVHSMCYLERLHFYSIGTRAPGPGVGGNLRYWHFLDSLLSIFNCFIFAMFARQNSFCDIWARQNFMLAYVTSKPPLKSR